MARVQAPTSARSALENGASAHVVAHLTPEERFQRGRAARNEVPRARLGDFEPAASRPDPVALLEEEAVGRLPELVPIRHGRMLTSPFAYYRGTALNMASDLAALPRSGLHVQACGDAHLNNFGAYASAERRLVIDINDFDETAPGPWEWDVQRLVASLEIAGRHNGYRRSDRESMVAAAARQYRQAMADFAGKSNLDVWYARFDVESSLQDIERQIDPDRRKRLKRTVAGASARDNLDAYNKLARVVDGVPRIVSQPPLIVPLREMLPPDEHEAAERQLLQLVRRYRATVQSDRRQLLEQYRLVELGRKVVGVGSVGTRAWIALFMGRDAGDPLFLQIKEAQESVLERFVGKSGHRNHGQRVVSGQRLMQATSDIFLGWLRATGWDGIERDFYVRQLRDWKVSVDSETMRVSGMVVWARVCAWSLARAHARSGDRIAIAGYLGSGSAFDKAMVAFSQAYADQNERDFDTFSTAVKEGRLQATQGV